MISAQAGWRSENVSRVTLTNVIPASGIFSKTSIRFSEIITSSLDGLKITIAIHYIMYASRPENMAQFSFIRSNYSRSFTFTKHCQHSISNRLLSNFAEFKDIFKFNESNLF